MVERRITFTAIVNDKTGDMSIERLTPNGVFSSLEMLGILDTFKADIVKDQFPKVKSNVKKKKN